MPFRFSLDLGASGERRGSTVAQLKDDIDSGRTGDRSGGFDPAAAPLGTDEEAAGTPPSPETVHEARRQERRMNTATMNAADPTLAPDGRSFRSQTLVSWIGWGLMAGVLLILAVLLLL